LDDFEAAPDLHCNKQIERFNRELERCTEINHRRIPDPTTKFAPPQSLDDFNIVCSRIAIRLLRKPLTDG
jgi:hypothetical protein